MKFTESDVLDALKRATATKPNPDLIDATMQNLAQIAEENKPDPANKAKRVKTYICGLVVDQKVTDQVEQQIWLVQAKEGIDHNTILDTIKEAGKVYNESILGKKKKEQIKTLADHFLLLKPKMLKDRGIKILTKEAIILVKFTN